MPDFVGINKPFIPRAVSFFLTFSYPNPSLSSQAVRFPHSQGPILFLVTEPREKVGLSFASGVTLVKFLNLSGHPLLI